MFAIQDTTHESPCYLKFVTPQFPVGLWTGDRQARSFETESDARADLMELVIAITTAAYAEVTRIRQAQMAEDYRQWRLKQVTEKHTEYIEGIKVVPHPTKS